MKESLTDSFINCHSSVINSYNVPKTGGVGSYESPGQPPVTEYVTSQKDKVVNGVGGRDAQKYYNDSTPGKMAFPGHTSQDFTQATTPHVCLTAGGCEL